MNLGIVGNGQIVQEFLKIKDRITGLKVKALCARRKSRKKVTNLAEQFDIPQVFYNYDEFLKEKDIDTVYVAVVNDLHYDYASRALMAGKNVILEKPFTSTLKEAQDLFRIAGNKDKFLFEAISSIFTKGYKEMKNNLPKCGKIRIVEANFSQYSSRYDDFKNGIIRPVFDANHNGGALYDLNIYNLHIAYGLFGPPQRVHYYGIYQQGVDTSGVIILIYKEFICSLIAAKDSFNDPYFNIQGEKAVLIQRTSANICGPFEIEYRDQNIEYFDGRQYHKHRLENEFNEIIRIINTNDLYEYEKLRDQTLGVMKILDNIDKIYIAG